MKGKLKEAHRLEDVNELNLQLIKKYLIRQKYRVVTVHHKTHEMLSVSYRDRKNTF